MADTYALFRKKAPVIMRKLMQDFGLDDVGAAAIVGNLGHESAGFRFLQEIKPLIPGSRGGYGWAQWTAERRVAFERYCKVRGLPPESDEANYGFLCYELRNTEKGALPAVREATTLRGKVVGFELGFERASPKHKGYDSRMKYAEIALAEYRKKPVPAAVTKTVGTVAAGGALATAAKGKGASSTEALMAGAALIIAIVVVFLIARQITKSHNRG
jgi:hypothetical protein